ncbi:hypothetical protein CWR48_08390 [Oceanobacillus arenosus]|uniref:Uncharacterized protein n=2 Tax=Oceanobacillus arenosus TaxID=1229153 RepID=A0A3D8PWS5_9BACI|nr:hypothetical protein CWR48_08390 [Oceanobacillus arenosus]
MVIFFNHAIPVDANPEQTVAVSEKSTEWAAFIYTTIIIGGTIISTLSYVSWRKYKAEQKRKQSGDKLVD